MLGPSHVLEKLPQFLQLVFVDGAALNPVLDGWRLDAKGVCKRFLAYAFFDARQFNGRAEVCACKHRLMSPEAGPFGNSYCQS